MTHDLYGYPAFNDSRINEPDKIHRDTERMAEERQSVAMDQERAARIACGARLADALHELKKAYDEFPSIAIADAMELVRETRGVVEAGL